MDHEERITVVLDITRNDCATDTDLERSIEGAELSPREVERWDRRERGETPVVFEALRKRIYEQQLEMDRLRSEKRRLEREILQWIV